MFAPRIFRVLLRFALPGFALFLSLSAGPYSKAQSLPTGSSTSASPIAALRPVAQTDRIAAGASLTPQLQLTGHIPVWATPAHQTATSIDLSQPIHISLILRRDPAAEAALDHLLADQQNPSSSLYHQWLTPEQMGALFGPTQADLDAITSWATSQGLTVASVQPNRVLIELTGTIASVAGAFHTAFAYFDTGNAGEKPRFSATVEPSIPAAFSAVIQSIHGLTETHLRPMSRSSPQTLPTNGPSPEYTQSSTQHYILPNDFAVIYDIASVYSGGNKGATIGSTPQHIAIIGESRVVAADISNYASLAGLTSYNLNTILAGPDPGTSSTGAAGEATLDVSRVIGTAPDAQVDLVISANSNNSDGVDTAISYNINTLRDPIMTISFGSCEAEDGQSTDNFYNNEFQTAVAGGMSIFISAGDAGAAGCDANFSAAPASQVLSINALCASPYVTCVGGTEFNDTANPSLYWSSSNSAGNESALSYIPEGAWNEPNNYSKGSGYWLAAGGGGTSVYISRPSWQTGSAFPSGSYRLTPDVSFSSSDHNGYLGCFAANGGSCVGGEQGVIFSGTSAAAPGMAGIAALINTKLGSAQGNINPLLYGLYATTPTAFHDATVATSGVTNCSTATPSMCNNSTPGPSSLSGGLAGYELLTGYDEATGLGSLDVARLLAAVGTTTVATSLAVTPSPSPALTNQAVILTARLTPGASSATPTGHVQFYANGAAIGSLATLTSDVATLSYTFTTAGTYSIYAIYSGDTNFTASTAPTISLVVNTPAFTVTPATTSYTLISGTTSGNTDVITVASVSSFAGQVALTCTPTTASGNSAGSCSIKPTTVTLTAGGTSNGSLTITTSAGTSGVLDIAITGTSGTTSITSATIIVNLTASSFTLTPSPAALPVSGTLISGSTVTSTVTVASVNGFAGNLALACGAANLSGTGTAAGTCTVSPATVTLTSGGTANSTISVTTTPGTSGALTATITGTGTTANSTIATTASTTVIVTVVTPGFTLAPASTMLTFTSGATTGNTDAITAASFNGFAGSVALTCFISTGSAAYQPSCLATPASVTLTAGGTATSVISITSTTAQTMTTIERAQLDRRWSIGSGAFFAMLLFIPAFRRRRNLRSLAALALTVFGFTALSGCSSSAAAASKSSAGTYTATITGTGVITGSSISTTATTSFQLTIN